MPQARGWKGREGSAGEFSAVRCDGGLPMSPKAEYLARMAVGRSAGEPLFPTRVGTGDRAAPAGDARPHSAPDAQLVLARECYARGFPAEAREPRLASVLQETLSTPGNLTRLRLGLIAADALALPGTVGRPLATALEYFHTASLLLDDLPAMDDATVRRGRPCMHRAHGEGATILGALAFINRAYRLIWEALGAAPAARREAAAAHVERCLGSGGVLDGQSQDLHFGATDGTARTVARIALGKTVSLLRLSLVTPALLAGVEAREQLLIDRLSVAWGLAYQIADDFADVGPGGGTGKTPGRDLSQGRPNFVVASGHAAAGQRLGRLLHILDTTFISLTRVRAGWSALARLTGPFSAAASALLPDQPVTRCA